MSKDLILEQSVGIIQANSISSTGRGKCKIPEATGCLLYSKNYEEVSGWERGARSARGEEGAVGDEVRTR